jgi:hypothetical protein
MGTYQAYLLDKDGHIPFRHDLLATEDDAALLEAPKFTARSDVEIWDGDRLVARIPANKSV